MKLIRTGKTVGPEGTTIIYEGHRTGIRIESRKRHIPHANGSGTWDYTSYFVVVDGKDLKEIYTLKAAKEWAEDYLERNSGTATVQA